MHLHVQLFQLFQLLHTHVCTCATCMCLLFSCIDSGNGRVNSECDLDSMCSDSSWVITPAPTFKRSSGNSHGGETSHPLEDLLIEHPAMSVYRQNSTNEVESLHESEGVDEDIEEQNVNRELALVENRRRQQLAAHMEIPAKEPKRATPKSGSGKPPKLTRRALKRHNPISRNGAKKCGFKAGRRRC